MRMLRIRSRLRDTVAASILAVVLLFIGGASVADEAQDQGLVTDSSSDRLPMITAFPKYPSVARRDRIEGQAVVCFHINSRGKIVRAGIRSSTHKIFERPAMRAIMSSSFAPLAEGEKPSAVKTCRTYRFRLDPVNARDEDEQPGLEANDPSPAGRA